MPDFTLYPNLNRLLHRCKTAKDAKDVLDKIIAIRCMLYHISFYKNDGKPVKELNSIVDKDFTITTDIPFNISSFISFVNDITDKAAKYDNKVFTEHETAIKTNCPELFNAANLLAYDTAMYGSFPHEAENPTCVKQLLAHLFFTDRTLDKSKRIYEFSIYDLNDYRISFADKETLDFFASNIATRGTAGVISPSHGEYAELYSI